VVEEVQSGNDGRFSVTLAPGSYVVHLDGLVGAPSRPGTTMTVTVLPLSYTVITVRFPSGIR
jgi:hypothetical protein